MIDAPDIQVRTGAARFKYGAAAVFVSLLLGSGAGIVMARIAPSDKFSWAGLAVAPLWILLEIAFESHTELVGYSSSAARVAAGTALLVSFYVAWFLVRPLVA